MSAGGTPPERLAQQDTPTPATTLLAPGSGPLARGVPRVLGELRHKVLSSSSKAPLVYGHCVLRGNGRNAIGARATGGEALSRTELFLAGPRPIGKSLQ